ncbi:head decoration protein [Oscillospiraceae bacterium WX1]
MINSNEVMTDNLIAGINPPAQVAAGTISKLDVETTYTRGTLLAKSENNGKLYILGTVADEGDTLTAECILADDTAIGTSADVNAEVYVAGYFNTKELVVKTGYTMTETDKDALRERGNYLGGILD